MYKNQLQELAQRSCFNLPSYSCIREGPDHAPRFKASVNFNGEVFESPAFCNTLRQAEHSAAEVALQSLSSRAPSHSLAAKILDETGVYKNLLQEISQRVGARLPTYTTFRSGLGHLPVFTCTVELAGIIFTGEPAKNKKQAEKNAAMTAWSSLKKLAKQETSSSTLSETTVAEGNDEQEQITIARALLRYRLKEKMVMAINLDVTAGSSFLKKFPLQPDKKPSSVHSTSSTGSKILPLIRQQSSPRTRPSYPATPIKFPGAGAGAAPYMPIRQYRPHRFNHCNTAAPVTMRTAVPVFASPPSQFQPVTTPLVRVAPPVQVRQAVSVFGARPYTIQVKQPSILPTKQEITVAPPPPPTKEEVTLALPPLTKQEVTVSSPSSTNQEFPTPVVPQTEQSLPAAAISVAAISVAAIPEQLSPPLPTPTEATQELSLAPQTESETPEIISESTEIGDDDELTKSVVRNNLENLVI